MELLLNSKIIESDKKEKIKNAIILLHGYGGDGTDISSVAYSWKRFIDNTVFLCPDGHEACKLNPNGFQWFDLSVDDNNYIISEVKNTKIPAKTINPEPNINAFPYTSFTLKCIFAPKF